MAVEYKNATRQYLCFAGFYMAVVYLDVQNLYNRENLFGYRYTVDPEYPNNERPVDNVGLLPTFGFSIEW